MHRSASRAGRGLAALLPLLLAAALLPGQEPPAAPPAAQEGQQPMAVAEVVIEGAGDREAQVRAALRTRAGVTFDPEVMRRDIAFLWRRMRVRVEQVLAEQLDDRRVRLILRVVPVPTLRRVVFAGNEEYDRDRLLLEADLAGAQEIDRESVPRIVNSVESFYRREGYHFVDVEPIIEEERDQLRLVIHEGPLVRIGDIEFSGNESLPGSTFLGIGTNLAGEMEAGDGWFIFPGSRYTEDMIQRDLVALERIYHDYGFLEAEVGLESVEFYRGNKRVRLVIHIHEGPRYTVRSVRVEPAEDGVDLIVPEEELLALLRMEPGAPFERDRVAADESALRRFYGRRGHPAAARAGPRAGTTFFRFNPPDGEPQLLFDPEAKQVDVVYRIQEGRPARIRDVIVKGNTLTQDRVVRREISLEPGDLADTDEALRSWRRLVGLNYFMDPGTRQPFVDWRFLETDREDWVDLQFEVADGGPTGSLLFGGGLNSNIGPFLSFSVQKNNFDLFDPPSSLGSTLTEILNGRAFTGAGQTLRLMAAPGTDFSQYTLNFTEPDLFGDQIDRISLNTNLFKTFFFIETHDETRTGATFRFGRNFGRYFTVFVGPEYQKVNIDGIRPGAPGILTETAGTNAMAGMTVGLRYNTVDDPFAPVDGVLLGASYRQVGEFFGGDFDFGQTELEATKYFPLWEDGLGRNWVIAQRGVLRLANETGTLSGVPYSERFFLGGYRSLRGFDFRGVGPRVNGFPLGGEASWSGSTELRFPLVSTRVRGNLEEVEYVRGVAFLDYGSVGPDLGALGPTRLAAGLGVRVRIPFMPQLALAFDFGWPLQSEPLDDSRVFSFNLGFFQ